MLKIRLLNSKAQHFLMSQTEGLDLNPDGKADQISGNVLEKRKNSTKNGLLYEVLMPIKLPFLANNKLIPFGTRLFLQLENNPVLLYVVLWCTCIVIVGNAATDW